MQRFLLCMITLFSVLPLQGAEYALPQSLSIDRIRQEMEVGRRYFSGSSYARARAVYSALLQHPDFHPLPPRRPPRLPAKDGDKEKRNAYRKEKEKYDREIGNYDDLRQQRQRQREEAYFYQARAWFEQIQKEHKPTPKALTTAFYRLANNTRYHRFDKPLLDKRAWFWLGQCHLRGDNFLEAARAFRHFGGLANSPSLDARNSWHLAQALIKLSQKTETFAPEDLDTLLPDAELERIGNARDDEKEGRMERALIQAAIEELGRITGNYPQSEHRQEAEVRLMELRLKVARMPGEDAKGQYLEIDNLAERFLQSTRPRDPNYGRVLLIRGKAAHLRSQMEKAIQFYCGARDAQSANDTTRQKARLGLGYAYAALAQTVGAGRRESSLRNARQGFRNALREHLERLELNRNELQYARLTYSNVLLQLQDYEDALKELSGLYSHKALNAQAHYNAGLALRGQKNFEKAVGHFEQVLTALVPQPPRPMLLHTLMALADLEDTRGRSALSLVYATFARTTAAALRDQSIVASAGMKQARALIAIGDPTNHPLPEADRLAAASQLQSFAKATAMASDLIKPVLVDRPQVGPTFGTALTLLKELELRHGSRIRMDELNLYRGRAIRGEARARSKTIYAQLPEADYLDREELLETLERFTRALRSFRTAFAISPRGAFAATISLDQGNTCIERSDLSFAIATWYFRHGNLGEHANYAQEGKTMLDACQRPFLQAIQLSKNDNKTRNIARVALGDALMKLGEYGEAIDQFQTLADAPDTSDATRVEATRQWAIALDKTDNTNGALQKLFPFVSTDLRSALLAGKLLEREEQYSKAHSIYLSGLPQGTVTGPDATVAAELLYRTHDLALRQARAIGGENDEEAVTAKALGGLRQLIRNYSRSDWAIQGVLAYGHHLLRRERHRELTAYTNEFPEKSPPLLRCTIGLLKGQSLIIQKQYNKAGQVLQNARPAKALSSIERFLSARIFLAEAELAKRRGEERSAAQRYEDVFARFADIPEEADQARLEAARLAVKLDGPEEGLKKAEKILNAGHNRVRMHKAKIRLRTDARKQ